MAEAFVVTPDLLPEEVPELAELGLDPVAAPVSWTAFAQALVSRRTEKLKPLLLDPTFVVGLGNLYADEILHDAGLRPDREVSTLSTMEIRRLYRSLVEILHEATKHHGTSLPDHPFTDLQGKEGSFQEELQVWGRDGGCRRCRQTVTKQRSGGRTTWWCRLPGLTPAATVASARSGPPLARRDVPQDATLKGFKSSPSHGARQPGVTVVVGPNGSGSQRRRRHRLGARRPPRRCAARDGGRHLRRHQKSGTRRAGQPDIDNSAGSCPSGSARSPSPTLWRTGEQYAINGVPCRLLD